MSLYYDAASILTSSATQGSLKSRIYRKDANLKSKPAHVYALISEAAKYDVFLKDVVDDAGLLALEPKLTPLLALLLVHDHFFAKGGIAASSSHPLRQSVERHKARLQSEFTKARLKRKISSVEKLKIAIQQEKGITARAHPRWARINTIKLSADTLLRQRFPDCKVVGNIEEVLTAGKNARILHHDKHIPNLLAFPPEIDLTKHPSYLNGEIILQDKASCFPAHLLFGSEAEDGQVTGAIDGCAAPGNKTTHMAALAAGFDIDIYACERDATRSKTLQMMVDKAGAGKIVQVLAKQDFLALDPQGERFRAVSHLLLDPSCSGSGILGREDVPQFILPKDTSTKNSHDRNTTNSKKRKRDQGQQFQPGKSELDVAMEANESDPENEQHPVEATKARLEKLSNLQSRIVEHAFSFPSATKVTYSTCSMHVEENEAVVARVLKSVIARQRGWTVLERKDQVHGMQIWKHRGIHGGHSLSDNERDACIRCTPDDGEGTMGFFVCGFVRKPQVGMEMSSHNKDAEEQGEEGSADEWGGFSDG